MKLKKGDNVQIMVGKDRGKQGKILKIDVNSGKVFVQGLNLFKKHQRPKKQGEKGEVITVNRPLNLSNLMVVCNSCAKPARVGIKMDEAGNKARYCKKCNANI